MSLSPTHRNRPQPLVVRTVEVATDLDLVDLLPAGRPFTWLRRGEGLVGWGEAARIDTTGADRFADAREGWLALVEHAVVRDEVQLPGTGPVAFGSFAFDDSSPAGGSLVVPEVVVGRRDGRTWVTTAGSTLTPPPLPVVTSAQVTAPGEVVWADGALTVPAWSDAVRRAVAQIRAGRLDKVVLARDVVARTTAPLDLRWALRRLAAGYDTCWTFSVDGLIGATPELLVRARRGLATSRVLAGTIRRTGDELADLARAAVLAHSSKDLEEHEYAVTSVADALAASCESVNVPDVPFVLSLPNVLHLASDVTGVLAPGSGGSLAVAASLHPTAAVCGTPTPLARDLILELERMDRGRYAGPVGWTGADGDGEWGIGLRSAQVDPADPHRLRLFAGCGVVGASDPDAEVAESEAKLEPMRWALGAS